MWIGVLLALCGAASWSCANVAIKGVGAKLGPWPAMVWAQLIGGSSVAALALALEGPPTGLTGRAAAMVALAGVSATLAYAGLFAALAHGAVAVVTPIISSWTVISVIIGALWLHERVDSWVVAGVAAVLAGNVLLAAQQPRSTSAGGRSALAWALVSACGFGVMMPAVNAVGAQMGRLWTVPLVWAMELTLVVPVLLFRGRLRIRPTTRRDWFITGRASLFEVAGFVAVSFALGAAPISVVSPLASLATAGSVLLGLWLLRERPGRWALLGAGLASLGVVLVNLRGQH